MLCEVIIPPMRSALSLTLVLLAAISGHAGACELAAAQHPLRLLLSAGAVQSADNAYSAEFNCDFDSPATDAAELHASAPTCSRLEPASEPASRSYESAAVAGVPSRGP
jgi:hypothetical protein